MLCALYRSIGDWESKVTICLGIAVLSFVAIKDAECIVWMPVCKYAPVCSYWDIIVYCKPSYITALI